MKRNTLERREKIKDLILEKGLWSLNKKKLARDFQVSYPTIYNDIKVILREIPDDKIEEIGYELNQSFKEALSIARRLLKRKDDSLKLRAIDVLTKVIDRYTGFLEAFGKKSVTPDKLDINQGVSVSKYNELADEFNLLLSEYTALYNDAGKYLEESFVKLNLCCFKLKADAVAKYCNGLIRGRIIALKDLERDGKITKKDSQKYDRDYDLSEELAFIGSEKHQKYMNKTVSFDDIEIPEAHYKLKQLKGGGKEEKNV